MEVRVTGWHSDKYFSQMNLVSTTDDGWRAIVQCPKCHQYWLVDEYDKLQSLFAFKIDSPDDLEETKFLDLHKAFLLKAHGGESKEGCKMAGCGNNAVNGMAFCASCLVTKRGVYE
jgi:hypothetical protein